MKLENEIKTNEYGVIKTRNRKTLAELRSPRQKFIARWRREFPWLLPNRADESIGLCTICNQELVCKTSHLDRHQKTFKHTRLGNLEIVSKFDNILPEADLIVAHTSGYLDSDHDFSQQDEMAFDDETMAYTTIKVEPLKLCDNESIEALPKAKPAVRRRRKPKAEKAEIPIMFEAIETAEFDPNFNSTYRRDVKMEQGLNNSNNSKRTDSIDYYYMHPPPQQPKDSFDLFFESISATVKSFPPKLAAELKGRVSQLITEFEIRSICEKEAQEKAAAAAETITQQSVTVLTGNVVEGEEGVVLVKYPQV